MSTTSSHTPQLAAQSQSQSADDAILPYVQACVQTLSTPTQATKQPHAASDCLWISADEESGSRLQDKLADSTTVATLSDLAKRPTLERHALVCFWLPALSSEYIKHYLPLLMRFRDLYAEHLLVVVHHDIDLQPYGLTPLERFNDVCDAPVLWQFNLYDYKALPDWFNSRFWANPENWDKHRW